MKVILNVDNTTKNMNWEFIPEDMPEDEFYADLNTCLYHMVHPSSALFVFLIEDLKKNHPTIYRNYIDHLKSQEPVIAPENVLR